ncbi:hypothetical protein ACX0G9_30070 [Flavitalea flava]
MPFNLSSVTTDPNPVGLPGSCTLSYKIDGTAGIQLDISYVLSDHNNIVYTPSGLKTAPGKPVTLTGATEDISQLLKFKELGGNQQASFFVTIRATNKSNGATKTQPVQITIL